MTDGAARYEFRVWGEALSDVADRVGSLGDPLDVRASSETYLVSAVADDVNPKARFDLLDIKVLVGVRDGFQQWTVHSKWPLPLAASVLRDKVLPLLRVPPGELDRDAYTLAQLVAEVIDRHADLAAVDVSKRRRRYRVDGCACEVTDVAIHGRRLHTVAVESEDLGAVRRACSMLGLQGMDNVSYPHAIRVVLGGRFAAFDS